MPLAPQSQILLAFQTMGRIIKPTRTPQGAKNSAPNFLAKVEPLFDPIKNQLKAWIDDIMLYGRTENQLLDTIEKSLQIYDKYGLKISIKKSNFYLKEVRCCRRLIDSDRVRMDPSNIEGIRNMDLPRNVAELSEFIRCLQSVSYTHLTLPTILLV